MPYGYADTYTPAQLGHTTGATPVATTTPTVAAAPKTAIAPAYQGTPGSQTAATVSGVPNVTTQSIMNAVGNAGYTPAQSTVDPTVGAVTTSNVDTSADSFTKAIIAAQQPGNAYAQQQLNEQLANAGVIGGGAVGAQQQLNLQEQAALQGNLQSGLLSLKGDEVGQSEYNATQQNTANQANATNRLNQSYQNMGATNAADQFGITNNIGIATQDANNALAASQANQSTAAAINEYNAGAKNAASQYNISNQIAQAQGNDAAYNQFLLNQQNNANQDWLAQLNSQTSIATGGQAGQTAAYQAAFQQPSQSNINFANLGQAANANANSTKTTQPVINADFGAAGQGGTLTTPTYTPQLTR